MNEKQLESMLRDADRSSPVNESPAGLAQLARATHQRRTTRSRRIRTVGGWAACYLFGLATAWIWFTTTQQPADDHVVNQSQPADENNEKIGPAPAPHDQEQIAPPDKPVTTPSDTVAGKSRYQWLRQLGRESQQRNDLKSAVAYYSQALEAATDEELEVSYDHDDWLLISLKKDRASAQGL